MKLMFAFFVFLLAGSNAAYSQNKIYLLNEVKDGKVIEITPGEIKYKDPLNAAVINVVSRNKTLLLFNDKGGYLVVSKPDSAALFLSNSLTDNFIIERNDSTINADRIFTINKKILYCTIINEDILSFIITLNDVQLKIDKPGVALVIYKNGEHKLIADAATATNVLYSFQKEKKLNSQTMPVAESVTPVLPVIKEVTKDNENTARETSKPAAKIETAEKKQPVINIPKETSDTTTGNNDTDNRYRLIMAGANSLYERGEYSRAKYFYTKANELKPTEKEPLDGLEKINNRLVAAEKVKYDSTRYDEVIVIADSLANLKNWDSALIMYNKAKVIRPQDYYAGKEIKYVQFEINTIKAATAKKELETKFNNALAAANIAVKEKRYEDALAAYKEVLSIQPNNQYALDRVKILEYQISLKKATSQ